jgi:L-amino acid N-acyltransferase YncA
MPIRKANASDLPGILAIYNHEILHNTSVYTEEPQTLEEKLEWLRDKEVAGFPVFVVDDDGEVAGFGTYGIFRSFCGYRYCVEHSIYVAEHKRRRGYGKQLLTAVVDAASAQGMHTMIAAVDAQNEASIRLHLDFGFEKVGQFHEVGRKFDRWLNVVFLQKTLDARSELDSR